MSPLHKRRSKKVPVTRDHIKGTRRQGVSLTVAEQLIDDELTRTELQAEIDAECQRWAAIELEYESSMYESWAAAELDERERERERDLPFPGDDDLYEHYWYDEP